MDASFIQFVSNLKKLDYQKLINQPHQLTEFKINIEYFKLVFVKHYA